MNHLPDRSFRKEPLGRRGFLTATLGLSATATSALCMQLAPGEGALTKEERDRMTPAQVIDELKKGNERFRAGKMAPRNYLMEKRTSAAGQYPAAVVHACLDSRVPAEIIFDAGIGDTFISRVAGNVVNDDVLGSMEFGCAVAGAKLVVVLGHTACGAVKGAIDDVVFGNLTGLWRASNRQSRQPRLTARSRRRTTRMSMPWRERMSGSLSPRFGGAAPSWRLWRRKAPSIWLARCTISRTA